MATTKGTRRLAQIALAAVAFGAVLAWAVQASAATIDIGGNVFSEKCTPCHANIADTKPGAEIKFSHAYHMTYPCSACHTKFPHQPQGTVTPKMQDCFACHNLRHGPQGKLAKGDCEVCHNTPRDQLRPSANSLSAPEHTVDWAQKPHVEPGRTQLRTKCLMCHTWEDCDKCHREKGVTWQPAVSTLTFDPQQACQVCHGQTNLTKLSTGGVFKSFEVLGVQQSAHTRFSCVSCHVDFRYTDVKYTYSDGSVETKLWNINAGLGCRDCHEGKVPEYAKQVAQFGKVVKEYDASVHRQQILAGNYDAATCASCHGGHDIQRLDTAAAKAAFHATAQEVCGSSTSCHVKRFNSYNDYYHGAAYKKGAPDAPACWQCHGSHYILPASDKNSMVSAESMSKTCGTCHPGSKESFSANAGDMIHQKVQVQDANWLQQFVGKVKNFFSFI